MAQKDDAKTSDAVITPTEGQQLIEWISGRWYGDQGKDSVFLSDAAANPPDSTKVTESGIDPSKQVGSKGFITDYNETLQFYPLSIGILNPRKASPTASGETIYGTRYVRMIQSTQGKDTGNPFASGNTIHEETGYILFCYNEEGNLGRIVKSLAIPRAQTVLAHTEAEDIKFDTSVPGKITFSYQLKADVKDQVWNISNGRFLTERGAVTAFDQVCTFVFDIAKPGQSTFTYSQASPLSFKGRSTQHSNQNTLRKQS